MHKKNLGIGGNPVNLLRGGKRTRAVMNYSTLKRDGVSDASFPQVAS